MSDKTSKTTDEAKPGVVSSVLETALTAAAVTAATTMVHTMFKWLRSRKSK